MTDTRKDYTELTEYAVEMIGDYLRIFQMHSSFLTLDGWTNQDMEACGFQLLNATFKSKSINNGKDEILDKDKFTTVVQEPKQKLRFMAYRAGCGHDINEWKTSFDKAVEKHGMQRGKVTGLPIAIKTMRIRSLDTDFYYDWKFVSIPSIHREGYEDKLILVKIENSLPSVLREEGDDQMLKLVKKDLAKITEIYCQIEKGAKLYRVLGSCAS